MSPSLPTSFPSLTSSNFVTYKLSNKDYKRKKNRSNFIGELNVMIFSVLLINQVSVTFTVN